MLKLRTFGGITLLDERGDPIPGALSQPRPVALVAVLAASGQHGMTRDKLLGLLWSEATSERARHSLTQCLYAARRAFGVDDLFITDGPIRLNRDRIWTDAGAFDRALDVGDMETAASLYAGPFLDGFVVPGSTELDRWTAVRRGELEDRAVAALNHLADSAESSGLLTRAVALRKRVTAVRPLDGQAVTALVTLLVRAGNTAEAIWQADEYDGLLRAQTGLRPDPRFLEYVARMRESALSTGATGGVFPGSSTSAGPNALALASRPSQSEHSRVSASRRHGLRVALVLAVGGIGAIALLRMPSRVESDRATAQAVLVAPFDVSGASGSIAYLGTAVAELLTPRLVIDSSTHAIDVGSVFAAWRAHRFDRAPGVPADSAIELAKSLGANRVVVGSVIGTRSRVVLAASMLAVPRRTALATASVEGPADSVASLVRQLTAKLFVSEAGESEHVAVRSSSLVALRQLLAGRAADRVGDYVGATRHYAAALAADSSLGTAALRLAIAADRTGNADLEANAIARAWKHRDSLDDGERAILEAFAGPRYPQPSRATDQFATWISLVDRDVRNSEGWVQLGARLFHEGNRLGTSALTERTTAALERALAIDPDNRIARGLLAALHGRITDSAAGPIAEHDALTTTRAIAMEGIWNGRRLDDAQRAIARLAETATNAGEAVDAALADHSLSLNQGRRADALAATRRLRQLRPDSHAFLRLRVLDALYGQGDSVVAASAARELESTAEPDLSRFPLERRRRLADGCVLAQWKLAHADTTGVHRIIRRLETEPTRHDLAPVSASPVVCAELVEAAFAVATHDRNALALLTRLDSLALTSAVAGNAADYAHILIARLYRETGHPHHALAAIRKHGYMLGWPAYLTTAWREEWHLAEAIGDTAGASFAHQAYDAWRGSAAP